MPVTIVQETRDAYQITVPPGSGYSIVVVSYGHSGPIRLDQGIPSITPSGISIHGPTYLHVVVNTRMGFARWQFID
jgi:hypothetical protein